jgi:hypothetical protein
MTNNDLMQDKKVRHYFVDEAGDGTIYSRFGKIIIGTEGTSRYFILGLLEVPQPERLAQILTQLRQDLLADPYFRKVPSMQLAGKKTALFFHAKDDVEEVRREVFKVLREYQGLRFFAVVRDKALIREEFLKRGTTYHPNLLYDSLVSRLFKDRLHKDDEYQIFFASRGLKDRSVALGRALEGAKKRFEKKWGIASTASINLNIKSSKEEPCLQASDYMLWALQRLYERRQDRYWDYVWPLVSLVHDVDDIRGKAYGVYYTQKNPLTLEVLPPEGTVDIG